MSAEHECRRGRKCRTRTRQPDGTWTPGLIESPGLCLPCEGVAFEDIRRLGTDAAALDEAVTRLQKAGQAPKVGGTRDRPTPLNLAAEACLCAIHYEVGRWGRAVSHADDPDIESRIGIYQWLDRITSRLGTLVDLPVRIYTDMLPLPLGGDHQARGEWDGVDAVMRLADLHRRAQVILGQTETRIWLADPCHVCGVKALSPSRDQETITCRNCRNVWAAEKFAELQNTIDYDKRAIRT